jgi:carbon monoxide dehydrogenase subunit G
MEIQTSVFIQCPPEKVFTFMTDFNNDIHWWKGVLESKRLSGDGLGVGTTYWQISQVVGRKLETTFEITEYEPYEKATLKTLSGPMPHTATFVFEPVEDGTKLTFVADVETGGLFRMAESVLAGLLKKMTQDNFGNLKALMEAN